LRELGIDAELRGKSDIFAAGKKISGNAQYATANRMFSHGTLLFDTDLGEMLHAINPRQAQIESKAVQSVRNFVTNIRELLPRPMTLEQFREALLEGIFGGGPVVVHELTDADWSSVRELAGRRYMTWEWNIGRSPAFNVHKSERLPAGKLDARIDVSQGRIRAVKFYGDFSGRRDVAELENLLVGVRYDRQELTIALQDVDLEAFFGTMETAAFLDFLY
jgi:lipoate-protein ligase A